MCSCRLVAPGLKTFFRPVVTELQLNKLIPKYMNYFVIKTNKK